LLLLLLAPLELWEADPLLDPLGPEELLWVVEEGGLVGVGVLPVGVEVGAVVEGVDVVPVPLEESVLVPEIELDEQTVLGPARIVKVPDCAGVPLASLSVRPRVVPTGWSTFHTKEVPVKPPNCSRGAAEGSEPGRISRM